MVAALEIDPGLIREAVIDDGRHAVGAADRGHGAELTVGEGPADLVFRGEVRERPVRASTASRRRWCEAGSTASRQPVSSFSSTALANRLPETWLASAVRDADGLWGWVNISG